MKRILSLVIVLILAMTAISADTAFAYTQKQRQTALDQFRACAFNAEYGGEGRDFIVRWESPIRVYFEGDYSDSDIAFFFRFITELTSKVDGIPVIGLTTSEKESNIQIYFTDLKKMGDYIPNYTEGNWGYFTFWYSGNKCTRAKIAIATDVTNQKQRNHLLMEEFIGALGLANDHYLDKKSILYGKWTETQTLTEADWLMLSFLYDSKISTGLKWKEAFAILDKYY